MEVRRIYQVNIGIYEVACVTGVGSIVFNWLSCIHEYHKLRESNKR